MLRLSQEFSIRSDIFRMLNSNKYFENFKKYITGDNKGKISTTRILCKEIVWHLKYATSNYNRHLQRKHEVEFDL